MWGSIEGVILPTLRSFGQVMHDHPAVSGVYLALVSATLAMLVVSLWRGAGRHAYWYAVAFALLHMAFSWGDDASIHVYRIVALSQEYRAAEAGMLITNPLTGQVLPVFVFYGVLPYLPGTFLNLLGMPAWLAFKVLMLGQFLVLALGVQALLDYTRPADAPPARVNADFGIGILFLLANYVFLLWPARAAFAEVWVYSLVPWVALSILRPGGSRALVALFFIQAVSHPIVLAQALVCEIAVPFCLSSLSLRDFLKRWVGPLALALLLAAPFWLPQFLWKDMILGPAGLLVRFEDSFRTVTGLVHVRDFRSIGPWMPLALLVAIVVARGRLGLRFWIATGLTVALLMVQWAGLAPLVSKIPVLNMSVFVWRLMLPAAFLAFGAVLIGWRQLARPPLAVLSVLVALSALAMVWSSLANKDKEFRFVANAPDDRTAWSEFDRGNGAITFGVLEYLPRLDRLPESCRPEGEVQHVSYGDLRRGVDAQKPYVAVRDGAYGFVAYTASTGACGSDLVLGPVAPGERVQVSERTVNLLFGIRMVELGGLALLALILFARRRRSLTEPAVGDPLGKGRP